MSKKVKFKIDKDPILFENCTDEELSNLTWHCLDTKPVHNILIHLLNDIKHYQELGFKNKEFKFIIGCDSQRHGSVVVYATSIIFLRIGHGGSGYYFKEVNSIKDYLKSTEGQREQRRNKIKALIPIRIWNETLKSVHCAKWIDKNLLKSIGLNVNEIHIDVNKNSKFKSNILYNSVTGFIEGAGFIPVVKPFAWGASDVSDSCTK